MLNLSVDYCYFYPTSDDGVRHFASLTLTFDLDQNVAGQ